MTVERRLCAVMATAALGLAACGGDFGETGDPGNDKTGNVRLVNVSRTDFLELYEGNTGLTAGVAQSTASGYVKVSDGKRSFSLRAPGSSASVASTDVTVVRDDHHAVLAYTAFGAAAGTVTTVVLPEDDALPAANRAKLRVFNAATATGDPVDVHVVTTTCAEIPAGTQPTVGAVTGLQTGYVDLAASATPYRLCVTDAGDLADVRLDARLLMPSLRILTLALVPTSTGLQALAIDQQGAPAPVSPAASAP